MISHSHLPAPLWVTWVQLRSLVMIAEVTPSLYVQELTQVTGKSKATLYKHLSRLKMLGKLDWHSSGKGTIVVSFPHEQNDYPAARNIPPVSFGSTMNSSANDDLLPHPSYFPSQILGYLTYQDEQDLF